MPNYMPTVDNAATRYGYLMEITEAYTLDETVGHAMALSFVGMTKERLVSIFRKHVDALMEEKGSVETGEFLGKMQNFLEENGAITQ